jgi:hypothetical protein
MVRIVEYASEWIGEHGQCLFERDAVFLEILACFPCVPFELRRWHQAVGSPATQLVQKSHTATVRFFPATSKPAHHPKSSHYGAVTEEPKRQLTREIDEISAERRSEVENLVRLCFNICIRWNSPKQTADHRVLDVIRRPDRQSSTSVPRVIVDGDDPFRCALLINARPTSLASY